MKDAQHSRTSEFRVLLDAGKEYDRAGLTRAGRAFRKHARRSNHWGNPGTAAHCNVQGQIILTEIVNSEDTHWTLRFHRRYGNIIEGYRPDGRGARWRRADKHFLGFLEPLF